MLRHAFKVAAFLPVLVIPFLGSCTTIGSLSPFSKDDGGLDQVDDLVGRIGNLHTECELTKQNLRSVFKKLSAITEPGFRGDAVTAHAELEQEIALSENRADSLEKRIKEMKKSAEPFFEEWIADLKSFSNASMRARSQARLTETRQRYDAIVAAVDPAYSGFVAYNESLRDIALFLEHDFNASPQLGADIQALVSIGKEIDVALDTTFAAAETYVQYAALPTAPEPVTGGVETKQ